LTTLAGQDDNPRTVRSVRRAIVSFDCGSIRRFRGVIAPAHVHEADADHPAPQLIGISSLTTSGSHDQVDPQLADDDGHVVWLDAVTSSKLGFIVPIPPEVPQASSPSRRDTGWTAIRNYDTAPPHGPHARHRTPRSSPSLRLA
jgi:hypothetical protein